MQLGRKLIGAEGNAAPLRPTVCGLHTVRVVHHVCSKPDESRGQFKSLPALGSAWAQELSSMLSRPMGCPAEWAKSKAPEPAAPKDMVTTGVNVCSSSGDRPNSADAIAAKGF